MTQKDDLLNALMLFPDHTATNTELIDELGFRPASVRRLTGTLTIKGILERIDRGTYRLNGMFRHFISALFYCNGEKEIYYAVTFKNDNKNIFQELKDELEDQTIDKCSNAINEDTGKTAKFADDFGYESEFVEIEDVDDNYIYPDILVEVEE